MPTDENLDHLADDDKEDYSDKVSLVTADLTNVTLTFDGKKIDYFQNVSSIKLEQSVDNHHVARVVIHEDIKDMNEYARFDDSKYTNLLGKSFSMNIESQVAGVPQPVSMSFNGIIGNIKFKNSIDELFEVTIIAHSPTILMDGAKKNAFYYDQSATDIIGSVVSSYPVTKGNTESSPGIMRYCVQYRESDYDFVMRLASGIGMFAYYDGQEFRVSKANSDETVTLEFPYTLGSFVMELGTMAHEYASVAYNYALKKKYSQDSTSVKQQASLSQTSQIAVKASQSMYKKSGFSEQPNVIEDAQSLDKVLSAKRAQSIGRMIIARGQSGNPTVVAGHCIKTDNMGRIDGTYWVTKVTHTYDSGGYYNHFECVPIDIACPPARSARPSITNMQTAVVVGNDDPLRLGRIKVKFPWLDSEETPWVRFMTAHAGQERGWFALPEIGDEVLVGYEQGSPDLPIALGALYNNENKPPTEGDAENNVKMFSTKSGNKIVFTDTGGEEKIEIVTKDGKNLITMQIGGPTTIESEGAINIKAGGDILMEGANITLDSQGDVEIKAGMNAKLEGGVNTDVKAGVQLQLQGTTTTVKGTPIQLN